MGSLLAALASGQDMLTTLKQSGVQGELWGSAQWAAC